MRKLKWEKKKTCITWTFKQPGLRKQSLKVEIPAVSHFYWWAPVCQLFERPPGVFVRRWRAKRTWFRGYALGCHNFVLFLQPKSLAAGTLVTMRSMWRPLAMHCWLRSSWIVLVTLVQLWRTWPISERVAWDLFQLRWGTSQRPV